MDLANIKAASDEKTKYAFMTANLCNNALSELYFLDPAQYKPKASYLLSSFTIRFYRASLQYVFNAEFCKLFEAEDGRKNQNVSSLIKLNNYHKKMLGNKFKKTFEQNEVALDEITGSDFYLLQRELRDTKFSHSDIGDKNDFSIIALTKKEMDTGFCYMHTALDVINRCHQFFDQEYHFSIPNMVTTTQNFVTQYTDYQDYYFKMYYDKEL